MKILITGACGLLGTDIVEEAHKSGMDVVRTDILENSIGHIGCYEFLDITDFFSVQKVLLKTNPDIVVHCAAWTDVENAEKSTNQKKVFELNVIGTYNVAQVCRELNIKMVYISTDYVFCGNEKEILTPDLDIHNPLNYYGQTKLDGESIVSALLTKYFIIRTSWLFGHNGKNFIETMLRLSNNNKEIRVVGDQYGTPTYSIDLARLIIDMVKTRKYGYYHVTNEGGYISWYDFASAIFQITNRDVKVISIKAEEYSSVKRPFNSRMSTQKLVEENFIPLPTWQNALKRYLNVELV